MSAGHGTPIAGHALLQNTHRPSHAMSVALHLCGGHGTTPGLEKKESMNGSCEKLLCLYSTCPIFCCFKYVILYIGRT